MRIWNTLLATVTVVSGLCCGFDHAQAQSFPSRVITLVIPFAPGGSHLDRRPRRSPTR